MELRTYPNDQERPDALRKEASPRIPVLSVVIVNFNDRVRLGPCLRSLEGNLNGLDAEVIVVDNNSSDGSPEFLAEHFPWVILISNTQNLGFSKANNQAIHKSRGEFFLFLNTDTEMSPGSLQVLLAEMMAIPSLGAIGPALVKGKRKYQVSFGGKVTFFSELLKKCFLNQYHSLVLKVFQAAREVGWLSAACLLVRRASMEEAGLFDENFFLYFEDIDVCFRMREKGWKLIYFPRARVRHEGGSTTSPRKLSSRLAYRKSQVYYYKKHNSRTSLFLLHFYLRLSALLWSVWGHVKSDKAVLSGYVKELKNLAKEKN